MDFFPTLPPKVAFVMDKGNHHFVQAHHLLETGPGDSSRERDWYRDRGVGLSARYPDHWVTLDNGCWELGEPDVDALEEVAGVIHPQEIVLPDAFCNKEVTLQWMRKYRSMCMKLAPWVMIVPQGSDLQEWTQCAEDMLAYLERYPRITLGIPKVVETFKGGRRGACEFLEYVGLIPSGGVHLLGIWYRIEEAIDIAETFPFVRSIDTTLPYASAMKGEYLDCSLYYGKVKMEDEWWHLPPDPTQRMLAAININFCRRAVGGGSNDRGR